MNPIKAASLLTFLTALGLLCLQSIYLKPVGLLIFMFMAGVILVITYL